MVASAEALSRTIADLAPTVDDIAMLEPAKIGESMARNELLLFIKPEVFLVDEPELIRRTLEFMLTKLEQFAAQVAGVSIMGGRALDRLGIMSRHYGLINRLSLGASQMLTGPDRDMLREALGVPVEDYDILGGHEYLAQYPAESIADLDRLWFSARSTKLRSGVYARALEKDGRRIVLVNAFHPEQLAHFTNPAHRIVLILLHSDTDWSVLRNELVGTTFPEKADPGSIRGTLYAQPQWYGFESVTIANNAVHLSAGPFEGAFEIVNFFGNIVSLDPRQNPPLILRRMIEDGVATDQALSTLENPDVEGPQGPVDLFAATEDMNTEDAIAFWHHHGGES